MHCQMTSKRRLLFLLFHLTITFAPAMAICWQDSLFGRQDDSRRRVTHLLASRHSWLLIRQTERDGLLEESTLHAMMLIKSRTRPIGGSIRHGDIPVEANRASSNRVGVQFWATLQLISFASISGRGHTAVTATWFALFEH